MAVTVIVALPPPAGASCAIAGERKKRARLESRMVLRIWVFMSFPLRFLEFLGDLLQRGRRAGTAIWYTRLSAACHLHALGHWEWTLELGLKLGQFDRSSLSFHHSAAVVPRESAH